MRLLDLKKKKGVGNVCDAFVSGVLDLSADVFFFFFFLWFFLIGALDLKKKKMCR